MKFIFSVSILGALLLGSCVTTNDVVGGGIFQKRKYNDGFYWKRNSNLKESSTKVEKELDIFKDAGKSNESSILYSESTIESENNATIVYNESVNDKASFEESDEPKKGITALITIENLINAKNVKTADSQENLISDSVNQPMPWDGYNIALLVFIILIALLIIAALIILAITTTAEGTSMALLLLVIAVLLLYVLWKVISG